MKIQVKGLSETLIELKKDFKADARTKTKRVQRGLFNDIRAGNPVDTGRSRDGWRMTEDSIENDVPYVSIINKGTSKRAGLRFIEKAVLRNPKVRPSGIIVRNK